MNFSRLAYSVENRICTISLSRPEKRNALDDFLVNDLTQSLVSASKDTAVKVIVIKAEGTVFCAGADLDYLQKLSRYDFAQNLEDSKKLMRLFQLLYTMRKPVVAQVDGPAIGGGAGLATACDLVVASDRATFGYTEVSLGFIPAIVLTFLVRRVGEGRARELVLTARILNAPEAFAAGLVNKVVPAPELGDTVQAIARDLCTHASGASLGVVKEMFSKMDGFNFPDMLDYAANINAALRMSDDCKRGLAAFLKKEKIQW